MKKKQRKIFRLMAFVVALVIVTVSLEPITADAAKGYSMKYGKTSVTPGGKADTILDKAGEAKKTKKTDSCATEGYDYERTYKDFQLKTYTNNKRKNATEYVSSIKFLTKNVKTSEGIKIGSSEKTVKKKYRGAKEEFGIYTKTKGKTKIAITVSDGKVTEIEIYLK